MNPIYLHDWEDGYTALLGDFAISASALDGCEILLASYTYEDYSGTAFVLYRKDGQLYEVNGSHCSCFGLEDQWEPEATTVAYLRRQLTDGWVPREYRAELQTVLDALEVDAA